MAANGNNTNSGDEVYTSMYQVDEENIAFTKSFK